MASQFSNFRRLNLKAFINRSDIRARMASSSLNTNRLITEKSPYLLQHAHNPVNWFPWSQEAFDKAKEENKLIFLSIGYSTCHWCHVMERESFENEQVARLLNENFISIKVDREERPDIDKIYMTYVQVTAGGGGWPLSVWLTPRLKPVFGGTYFPPEDSMLGRPGFMSVLRHLKEKWASQKNNKLVDDSERITDLIARSSDLHLDEESAEQFSPADCVVRCLQLLENHFDKQYHGYGKAPKFPQCVNANFLLTLYLSKDEQRALQLVEKQLLAMAHGGIHDHLGGGFHRYSVDAEWHVPHFEKMLYDQAQMLALYSVVSQVTKEKVDANLFANVAHNIAEYVMKDLSHPEGGFYSAEDADSYETLGCQEGHKKEGAFYVWTWEQIHEILDENVAKIYCEYYCIEETGNVDPQMDPHGELLNQNVLINRINPMAMASMFDMTECDIANTIIAANQKLLKVRLETRPRPHLDDKIVTGWNGLMISGMAKAAKHLRNEAYSNRALQAVAFIKNHLYNEEEKTLLRSVYTEGKGESATVVQLESPIKGVLDDYAFLIQGLLDLYDATMDESLLEFAKDLQDTQDNLFWDNENGGYYLSASGTSDIIFKIKDDQDGAEPSANSVSTNNLLRLEAIFDEQEYRSKASKLIKLFAERLSKIPIAMPEMVSGVIRHSTSPTKVVLCGNDVSQLKSVCDQSKDPFLVVLHYYGGSSALQETLKGYEPIDDKPTAYVCKDFSCSPPTTDPRQLLKLLGR